MIDERSARVDMEGEGESGTRPERGPVTDGRIGIVTLRGSRAIARQHRGAPSEADAMPEERVQRAKAMEMTGVRAIVAYYISVRLYYAMEAL
jgi:hypothetical protein